MYAWRSLLFQYKMSRFVQQCDQLSPSQCVLKKKGKVKGQANYKYTHVRMDLFSCETVAMTKWASEFNIQVGE